MEISIKRPCSENWELMTPNDKGAFCGKCVKTVVDFSAKSLDEIKNFFELKSSEKVCGRFETQQLTALSFDAFFNEFKGFNFTKRFAVILCFTFGMWLFNFTSVNGQTIGHLKGDVEVKQNPIMGGVRVKPVQKDTCKLIETKLVKDKVEIREMPAEIKMGEVMAELPKKKIHKKPLPKK